MLCNVLAGSLHGGRGPSPTTWFGGHIGYGVRPRHRGRGYATEILRQSLVIARAEGVDRVLVICDEANVASATVIQRLGGRPQDVGVGGDGTTPIVRDWIT